MSSPIQVEIWSDIMCPFCYIGKRKFEQALAQFPERERVQVEWKSYQLDPELETNPDQSVNEMLAERKGLPVEQARQMNTQVTQMAKEVGLKYNMDKAVVANSFDAHRLIQLAKQQGKGDEAEERLFRAYFTEGRNIADHDTLLELGQEIGLQKDIVQQMLATDAFADEVRYDIREAQQLGLRGVPFFVLNRQYGVSGAQPPEAFLQALQQAGASEP